MNVFSRKYSTYSAALAVKTVLQEIEFANSIEIYFLAKTEEWLVAAKNLDLALVKN